MDEQIIVADGCGLMRNDKSIIDEVAKMTFYLSAFPCFLTCRQLTKSQKAEKYKSCLLLDEVTVLRIKNKLEYNLVVNCSAFWPF